MAERFKLVDPARAREYFEEKLAFTLSPFELKETIDEGNPPNVIDVRSREDYLEGHVPGALSLPEEDWASLRGLVKSQVNVVMCYSEVCHLAARAAFFFASRGFPVMELEGGIAEWKNHGYDTEKEPPDVVKRSA